MIGFAGHIAFEKSCYYFLYHNKTLTASKSASEKKLGLGWYLSKKKSVSITWEILNPITVNILESNRGQSFVQASTESKRTADDDWQLLKIGVKN